MLLFLLVIFTIMSSIIGVLYCSKRQQLLSIKKSILLWFGWFIISLCTVLICANRATLGLIFNDHASDIDFSQTISSDYIAFLVRNVIYAFIFIGVYLLLRKKLRIPSPWFLFALLIFTLIVYYPGIPSADGNNSYEQYLAHSYTDWQPPLFTLWWNLFGFKGVTFLINVISYYGGLIYISYYLYKDKKFWQNDLLIIFSFNPLLFTQLAIVWKDIGFVGFLVTGVAIYLGITRTNNKNVRLSLWCFYFLVLFLAIGFRINGVFAVFPLLYLGISTLLKRISYNKFGKISSIFITSIIITSGFLILNSFIVYHIYNAKKSYPAAMVMTGDTAYIACQNSNISDLDSRFFNNPVEDSRQVLCEQALNYFNMDALYNNWNNWGVPYSAPLIVITKEADYQAMKELWIKELVNYPNTYLKYRTKFFINDLFFQYWYPTNTGSSIADKLAQISQSQQQDMTFLLSLFLVGTTIAGFVMCIYTGSYGLTFIILLSSLLQLLGWYFFIPAHAARYFLWNDIAALLCIILFYRDKPKSC